MVNMTTLPYGFTPETLRVNGQTMSYLDEGKGPALVMVHGNPTWSYYYRNLVTRLKDRFRVIVPDHIGCGLSDKPQDYAYTLENHINALTELIEHLGLDEVSLVVHDWGGAIGFGYASRHPSAIKSLVVLNTAAFPLSRMPMRIGVCRLPVVGELLVRGLNLFAGLAVEMAVKKPLSDEVASGYLYPYDSWHNRVAVHRFVMDIPMGPEHQSWPTLTDIEKKLPLFKETPMLLIWGGKDFCFNDLFYDQWRKRFPKAEYHYFPEAGHYVLEDALEEACSLIDAFFSSNCINE
nr:alpha/beta fold hydrolase [Desulfobulbaceae bacterium]